MRAQLQSPDLSAALEEARGRLYRMADRVGRLASVRVEGPEVDPLRIVAGAAGVDLWYLRSPEGVEMVALGEAWARQSAGPGRLADLERAYREIATSESIALCGLAFDPDGPRTPTWSGFPPTVLVIPRLAVLREAGKTRLVLSGVAGSPTPLPDLVDPDQPARQPSTRRAVDVPPLDRWKRLVAEAARAVREGALQKVVLARSVQLLGGSPDPVRALQRLRDRYPDCTVFGVRRSGRWFLGATPERLVRVRDGTVEAMALAGTAPRGQSPEEDRSLAQSLLESPKERLEHRIVAEFVIESMRSVCEDLRVFGPAVVRTRNVQHLQTRVRANLRDGATILGLVGQLHPTPAVAGLPVPRALRWIEREGLDRGWYAGLVGWLEGERAGEFVVGIRSAVADPDGVVAFAGCGIVADSDPERELAESELKLRPILEAF